jgi:hypothetical protein
LPYDAGGGNWTCQRGYLLRDGKCLSDAEIPHHPVVELGPSE